MNTPDRPVPLRITDLAIATSRVSTHGLKVHGADRVLGLPLHSNGNLGADLLRVPAGVSFPIHTHPGDHLLLCLSGTGSITVDGLTYTVHPGDLYMIPGTIPHAVGAAPDDEHVLIAIGSPHKPVDSPERMTFTDWHGTVQELPLFHREDPA